ncbi:MAG: DUF4838 domain-containing protein [Candidatus Sumerlaeota bacterium]|nr:DUF4838 domain-containing protein [Candidatus Sumerlaeota bacterium]
MIEQRQRIHSRALIITAILSVLAAGWLVLPGCKAWADEATTIALANDGKALQPVVIATSASARVREAAQMLSRYLERISEAKFQVITGDGKSGIAVGLAADFPGVAPGESMAGNDPTKREDYLLRSHAGGIYMLGASEMAVEHAVWDLLYRIGHRQFFPGAHWEVIPRARNLSIAVNTREHPAYYSRRIWYGFGAWDYASQPYADWCSKNRATAGIELHTGHAYDGILSRNKAAFAAHPEYLGLVGGQRKSTKFCISNPGLRQLVVEDALRQLEKEPGLDSISIEPSDGGNWCECDACAKLGSITDRALILVNAVAAAINARYPGKIIGMYAYNFHSPAPNIRAHPQVVVSIATAFLKGGTLEETISGWSAKASMLGIREYYSVNTWDRDMPAAARGGNLDYLKRTIPEFHAKGARFLSAESSDNWGPNGLGYYIAARIMWDVREAQHVNELAEDFLMRSFSAAKEPMREFYRQLDGSQPHLVFADQLGRMFRSLEQARKIADTPEVRARLDDLTLYARYVDLYNRYSKAKGDARQQAFEALIRHTYRMRATMLIHAKALYRDLPGRDKSVTIPAGATWNVAEGKNPWKSSAPFAADELKQFITEGIERHPLSNLTFKPIAFGDELVSATPLKLSEVPAGSLGAARGKQVFYTRVDTAPAEIEMQITGGLIEHYRDRGNVRIELWKIGGASQTGERETLAAQDRSVPPDGAEHTVKLAVKEPGLYKLTLDDGKDRTLMKWNSRLPLTVKSSAEEPMNSAYSDLWLMYFYVPKGTKVIGLFGGEHGEARDSKGRVAFYLNGREPNYYSIDVPDGEDGKFWSIRYGRGAIRLLTVPPYFARAAAELLLPAEVVTKDTAR